MSVQCYWSIEYILNCEVWQLPMRESKHVNLNILSDFFFFFSCHGWIRQRIQHWKTLETYFSKLIKRKKKNFQQFSAISYHFLVGALINEQNKHWCEARFVMELWIKQLFEKKKIRQVTAHLLYIKLRFWYITIYISQLYNSRLQLNTSNSLELSWLITQLETLYFL